MKKTKLEEFEELVLLTVAVLQGRSLWGFGTEQLSLKSIVVRKTYLMSFITLIWVSHIGLAQDLYVDPLKGNDQHIGTINKPLATLERAANIANSFTGSGSISIRLFPGLYILKDKVSINPLRILNDTAKYIVEAVIMPDDKDWSPDKMPVIKSISVNNSDTQFPHATGFLVSSNDVIIRGLKFHGNPNPEDEFSPKMETQMMNFLPNRSPSGPPR